MSMEKTTVKNLIEQLKSEESIGEELIVKLLQLESAEAVEVLFQSAREVRTQHSGDKVFLYGFVYFSTWCKNQCNFCYYRSENAIERYRKTDEAVLAISKALADSGVHLIDLTTGEDPHYAVSDFEPMAKIIKQVKEKTGLPVMVSPGLVTSSALDKFKKAGCDWYALYQETYNRDLFKKLRKNQDFNERMVAKKQAQKIGLNIEEGLLVGVGESLEDIAKALVEMKKLNPKQVRVMRFVPQEGIPMASSKTSQPDLELKIISVMRLLFPGALIPASLDVDGIKGLMPRMNAGANVVTSIIPPKSGLMGVAQTKMDVEEGGRTCEEVTTILKELNLRPGSQKAYEAYMKGLV